MPIIKVSVEDLDSSEKMLLDIDDNEPLKKLIKKIVIRFQKPHGSVYGLKLLTTNDGTYKGTYITEDNFGEIKNGYFLKLCYSIKYYLDRIFKHLTDNYKQRSFEDLKKLSIDPAFITELARSGYHRILISHFISTESVDEHELVPCLISVVHLFQKGLIEDIEAAFVSKVLDLAIAEDSKIEIVKYALSVLHKILCQRDKRYNVFKELIINKMPIKSLTPFIWHEDKKDLQFGALLLINTIIRCCKDKKRTELIKEISLKQNREQIFRHIIENNDVNNSTAHELYVYQTYILSLFADELNNRFRINENIMEEFASVTCNFERRSILLDFDENECISRYKGTSCDDLLGNHDDINRFSLVSMRSSYSDGTLYSRRSTITNEDLDQSDMIAQLTLKALAFYKSNHYQTFCQSQIEEQIYEPGILMTSERVIKMLARLLHIGRDPDRSSLSFQPLLFCSSNRESFLFELYSRAMWLLSRTRREMKTSTYADYPKVMKVLEKQLMMVLEKRVLNFKLLTKDMIRVTYDIVSKQWQEEKRIQMMEILEQNPCVKELKKHYDNVNENLVKTHRINALLKGKVFSKVADNKRLSNVFIFIKLSENKRQFIVGDWDVIHMQFKVQPKVYKVGNITNIVEGKACPHIKENDKDYELGFSFIVDHCEFLNFVADDKKTAAIWIDALNILTGKPNRSKGYAKELDQLTKMDLNLHLMELQDIDIPKKPPPVPISPFDARNKPKVPPKPSNMIQ